MSLKVGIVGLPNVGKSTLFNALLKRQQALVANYPFATIEPNIGIVEVPDERLPVLAKVVGTSKLVYATVEFVDIAGLVAGAATGAGLGNKFLSHIREVDVIVQVLRAFEDEEIVWAREGTTPTATQSGGQGVDPKSDYEVVTSELILKDLETVEKLKNSKTLKLKTKENEKLIPLIGKLYAGLNSGKPARTVLAGEEKELAADLFLLTMKPEILVLNVSEEDLKKPHPSPLLRKERETIEICAKIEAELSGLSEDDVKVYMKELGITESGLDKLIRKAYETLGLMSFLTAGEIEVRAWTIRRGSTALMASGAIHTDFMKKFIKAKVVTYDDFVATNGWKGAAEAGKVRLEGKDYVMRDGDVVEFVIGA
ncbi:redox-regulated ATPase YchF [Candidatus Curtissbacteria bacterium]|nr:redox-regulated ATPase YchF [Candidatus Curtissbacteria bacterium]